MEIGQNIKTEALVELVDIYPTLCELAGLPMPEHLRGFSFAPLLNNTNLAWKKAAFSQYPRGQIMGYSIRTERYRFTRWEKINDPDEVEAIELYDLHLDPDALVNIADDPENKEIIQQLSSEMNKANIGRKSKKKC